MSISSTTVQFLGQDISFQISVRFIGKDAALSANQGILGVIEKTFAFFRELA
jgi:hypothetical protein